MKYLLALVCALTALVASAQTEYKTADTTAASTTGRLRPGIDANGRGGHKASSGNFVPYALYSDVVTVVSSGTITATSGWTTSAYNQLIDARVLVQGQSYYLQLFLNKPGTDLGWAVYLITAGLTDSGQIAPSDLVPLSNTSYNATTPVTFKVRLKRPTSGNGIHGIEMTINNASYAGGPIIYKLTKAPF